MIWLLAQDPTAIAEKLGQAQNVQQVLAIVVGGLLLFLLAVLAYHVREARRWETKYDEAVGKVFKMAHKTERALSTLVGLGDTVIDEE